jgi:glucose/arabinose dehydrogenase
MRITTSQVNAGQAASTSGLPRRSASLVLALFACLSLGIFSARAELDWRSDWELPAGFSLKIDTEGFEFPTAIAFVPNPGPDPKSPLYFVTELRGKVKVVTRDRSIHTFAENFFHLRPDIELPNPDAEMGMAGIALEPRHGYVFVSFAYQDANKVLRNSLVRFESQPGTFAVKAGRATSFGHLFRNDISRVTHQIGAIIIDGDAMFVSVGDGGQHFKSHDMESTLGKVLRMTFDGAPATDNPFYDDAETNSLRNYVWASGLRNPFGLCLANGRLFASENGFEIDRFLEIRRGANYGWDGTDWSIGMNVPAVFNPTVAPVHLIWLPPDNKLFPPEHRSKFYVAFAGGRSLNAGLVTLDYNFQQSRLNTRPNQFLLHTAERKRELDPAGVAIGPDGIYVAALYPVRKDKGARGAILRITHEPENLFARTLSEDDHAHLLMTRKGCYSCHGQKPNDLNVAPPLDRQTLVPRILDRLASPDYRKTVAELDRLDTEPFKSHRTARAAVLKAHNAEQAALWIKLRILEPMFDRQASAMPNLGLTEIEARQISDYLVRRNVGDVGVTGFFKSLAHPLTVGPPKRRHLIGAACIGFGLAIGMLLPWRAYRRLSARRRAKHNHDTQLLAKARSTASSNTSPSRPGVPPPKP